VFELNDSIDSKSGLIIETTIETNILYPNGERVTVSLKPWGNGKYNISNTSKMRELLPSGFNIDDFEKIGLEVAKLFSIYFSENRCFTIVVSRSDVREAIIRVASASVLTLSRIMDSFSHPEEEFKKTKGLKIGFSGVQSVGKTTVIDAIDWKKVFKEEDFHIQKGSMRKFHELGLPISENGTDITEILVTYHLFFLHHRYDNIVFDRTVWDAYAISSLLYEEGKITSYTYNIVEDIFFSLIKEFDHIFYIRPEFDIVPDGVRSTDMSFRDNFLKNFEKTMKFVDNITFLDGDVEKRKRQVYETLGVE